MCVCVCNGMPSIWISFLFHLLAKHLQCVIYYDVQCYYCILREHNKLFRVSTETPITIILRAYNTMSIDY